MGEGSLPWSWTKTSHLVLVQVESELELVKKRADDAEAMQVALAEQVRWVIEGEGVMV